MSHIPISDRKREMKIHTMERFGNYKNERKHSKQDTR